MWYVYVVKSQSSDWLYIGSTGDLRKRIYLHNKGLVASTKDRRPLKLIYYEAYTNERLARTREKRLKHFGSAYRALIKRILA